MTRARALKSIIRSRAEKTGERYTTARRHVLSALASRQTFESPADALPTPLPVSAPAPPPAAEARGAVSDARTRERTGHDLAYWFDVLDRFGAVERGHTASARHLRLDHGVDSWYSQSITVAYERARGVRTVNQRRPGAYEFSASKVVGGDAASIVAAFTSARRRARWTAAADPALRSALAASFGAGASAGFAVKANGRARHRYTWDGSTVEIYVDPKGTGRCSVVVQHLKLPSRAALEDRRRQWRAALAALAALFSS